MATALFHLAYSRGRYPHNQKVFYVEGLGCEPGRRKLPTP